MPPNPVVFIIPAILFLLVDLYVYQGLKTLTHRFSLRWKLPVHILHWLITGTTFLIFSGMIVYPFTQWPNELKIYVFAAFFIVYIPKLVYLVFLLGDDLSRGIKLLLKSLPGTRKTGNRGKKIPRSEFINRAGVLLAGAPFVSLIYGVTKGGYQYRVREKTIFHPDLPAAFRGLKIIQLSDFHLGSFTSTSPLKKAIRLALNQNPDIIFFTGDLVNYETRETEGFLDVLSDIKAPLGVYSILGNHDYGDYRRWPSQQAKTANLQAMIETHRKLKWHLLRNKNKILKKKEESIAILGVENWSGYSRFVRYGDLENAYQGTSHIPYKILLSHDPSHWNTEVSNKFKDINLTLSGHTHGMQFGIEIPGIKWSPAKYFYPQWAGLYQKGKQQIYVNRGLGFIGYPGRVGISPEITVINLEKG